MRPMNTQLSNTRWEDSSLAREFVNSVVEPVVVLDRKTRITEANLAFFQFVHGDRSGCIGKRFRECCKRLANSEPVISAVERLNERGVATKILVSSENPEPNMPATMLTAVPISLSTGQLEVIIRIEDVADVLASQADRELEKVTADERAESLARINEELEGFSYSVSHDLRAPLRFIDKFAYLLLENHSDELSREGLQYAEQIREGARQMSQLVEDLLEFSRATGQELARESVDLSLIARQVISEVQRDIEDRDITFHVGELGEVDADPALIKQVLANLFWNAVKFTRPVGQAEIRIERENHDGQQVYVVSDNGVGFDSSAAERLFTVFQRFHQPEEFEGSGVGLAIVNRIIERHGGRVWADGQIDAGARIYFTLESGLTADGED